MLVLSAMTLSQLLTPPPLAYPATTSPNSTYRHPYAPLKTNTYLRNKSSAPNSVYPTAFPRLPSHSRSKSSLHQEDRYTTHIHREVVDRHSDVCGGATIGYFDRGRQSLNGGCFYCYLVFWNLVQPRRENRLLPMPLFSMETAEWPV